MNKLKETFTGYIFKVFLITVAAILLVFLIKRAYSTQESSVNLNRAHSLTERYFISVKKEIVNGIFDHWPTEGVFRDIESNDELFKVSYNPEYSDHILDQLFQNESAALSKADSVLVNLPDDHLLEFKIVTDSSVIVPVSLLTRFVYLSKRSI